MNNGFFRRKEGFFVYNSFLYVKPGDQVFNSFVFMLLETVLMGLLTWYLGQVVKTEYGTRKPWHFPVSCWFKKSGEYEAIVCAIHPFFVYC